MRHRHIQTVLAGIARPPVPEVSRERLELDDGDFIDLQWGSHRAANTVLMLHGLEGSIASPYARRIFNYCNAHHIAIVMMCFRGCSGEANRLLPSYHSGETDDIRRVIAHLKSGSIDKLALLGYSVGGNRILKYLGETDSDPVVGSAVVVSVPYRLDISAKVLNSGFARIYQSVLLKSLVAKMQAKQAMLDAAEQHFPDPVNMCSIAEFDEQFTAPICGFDGAADYYRKSSSAYYLSDINKPVSLIHAIDDPFMSPQVIPEVTQLPSNITIELYRYGGHVGFVDLQGLQLTSWLEARIHQHLIDSGFCPQVQT
ncbi:MAG: putative alpha/beta-fold hydrolase [Planctomycetota bacterium]